MGESNQVMFEHRPIALRVNGLRLLSDGYLADRQAELLLQPGTITLVMGANGAGKTTWLEKLAGLRDPEGLKIRYGTESLWKFGRLRRPRLNPQALRCYSYAAQSPEQALFARSVREELRYSLRPYIGSSRRTEAQPDAEGMEQALMGVGLDASWLNRDPFRLSGGQRRRIALAAAFVTPAPWLLLDEPTAGLDRAGHERVAEHLLRLKREGRGIVLVSHDSDWALPLADEVLLLHRSGEFRRCTPEQLVHRLEWLHQAGMVVPDWLSLAQQAARAGVPVSRLWRPAEAAAALAETPSAVKAGFRPDQPACTPSIGGSAPIRDQQPHIHRLSRFDPRAVWLAYALLSAGLFSLSTWQGLLLGSAVVTALLAAGRISLRRWRGVVGGYLSLGMTMSGFAAVVTTGDGKLWDMEAFVGTLFPFARTLLVLLIGLSLPLVMTPLSLRRSLEQLVSWRGSTGGIWQQIILTITLMIRFVPVLLAEWERFGRIFTARGKETGSSPRVLVSRLRGISLPLLLALFRLGDDVATALESRGVRRGVTPTRGSKLAWKRRDTVLVGCVAALAGLLWMAG